MLKRISLITAIMLLAPAVFAAAPYLVKDINSHIYPASSFPSHFVTAGNYTFFTTSDSDGYPLELWRTDGTEAETIDLAPTSSAPLVLNGKVWFARYDGSLWTSDGTVAGTQKVTLPVPIFGAQLMATPASLYFYSALPNGFFNLYQTDGTANGTRQVSTIRFNAGYNNESWPTWTAAGPYLYFINDGGTGWTVWRTDGTTTAVADPNSNTGFAVGGLQGLGNVAVYSKSPTGYAGPPQLWRTDGTSAGTYFIGTSQGMSLYAYVKPLIAGSQMYFVASDNGGPNKLWRSDGTNAGTVAVATSLPGASAAFDATLQTMLPNGKLLLAGTPLNPPTSQYTGLWVYDGANVTFLTNMQAGAATSVAVPAGGYAITGSGLELWRSDGTIGGTSLLGNVGYPYSYRTWPMIARGSSALFLGYDSTYAAELWKTDGTAANTARLKDIAAGTYASYPKALRKFRNGVLFVANSNATDSYNPSTELWFSDGTEAGTQRLLTDTSGVDYTLTPCGGVAFFSNNDSNGYELWTTDGTAAGTSMLADLYPGSTPPYPNSGSPGSLLCVDNRLYFSARNASGFGLWRSDGTTAGTYMIATLATTNNELVHPVQYGHGIFFTDYNSLWVSNGTAPGTFKVRQFDSSTGWATVAGSYAYLATFGSPTALWRSNATTAGTTTLLTGDWFAPYASFKNRLVYGRLASTQQYGYCSIGDAGDTSCFDPLLAPSSSFVTAFKSLNGRLYYNKPNIMSTDLTTSVDTGLSADYLLTAAGGRLYTSDRYGFLKETDGSVAGTTSLMKLAADTTEAVESNGKLFIASDELYAYDLAVAATGLAPSSVPSTGGQQVTINGRGFVTPVSITVGGIPATVGAAGATSIAFTAPAHDPGTYTVTLTTGDGRNIDVVTPLEYTCAAPTAVINSTPGPVCPMIPVHLQGSGGSCQWYPGTGLDNPASCTPTATLSTPITYTLVVTNASGCPSTNNPSVTVSVFGAPDPKITLSSQNVASGSSYTASVPDAGPGAVYSWTATGVTIVGDPSLRTITFQTGCANGKLYVTVTNANGCSAASSQDIYPFSAVTISKVTPLFVNAGTLTTLTGTGFQCVNSVTVTSGLFTTTPVEFTVVDPTTIRFRYPVAGTGGYVFALSPASGARSPYVVRTKRDDLDGTGRADILWRNSTTGQSLAWALSYDGASITTLTPYARQSGTDYKVVGFGELGGYYGNSDILWQHTTTGELSTMYLDSTQVHEFIWPTIPAATMKVAATGDLDGDAFSEIIMRDTQTGATSLWKYLGSGAVTQTPIHPGNNLDWSIASSRDFDLDGKEDILWRNTNTGMTLIWFMNGATISSSQVVHYGGNPDWTIAGTGDFDGDGMADILWRHSSGMTLVWLMNGAAIRQSVVVHWGANLNWNIAAIGDYDGDTKSDILWRDSTTGQILYWKMNGGQIVGSVVLHPGVSTDWKIEGPRF